jgi:hypothetical protein
MHHRPFSVSLPLILVALHWLDTYHGLRVLCLAHQLVAYDLASCESQPWFLPPALVWDAPLKDHLMAPQVNFREVAVV